jgi:hypothetical protein
LSISTAETFSGSSNHAGQPLLVTFVEPFETRRGSCVDVVRCGDFVFTAIELVVSVVVDIGVVENV